MNDKALVQRLRAEADSMAITRSCGNGQILYDAVDIIEALQSHIEALEAALLPFVSKCDYIEELELSDDDYVECCPFQAVHYRRAKQAMEGSGNG